MGAVREMGAHDFSLSFFSLFIFLKICDDGIFKFNTLVAFVVLGCAPKAAAR